MPTTIRCSTDLPFPPARMWALLADPAVIQGRTAGHHGLDATVTGHRIEGADVMSIDTMGVMPSTWLPPVIAGRAEGHLPSVHRTETWFRTSGHMLEGRMTFAIRGVDAASAEGWMRVRGTGTETETETAGALLQEITIAVHLPLLGGLIERSLAGRIQQSLAAEGDYLAQQ